VENDTNIEPNAEQLAELKRHVGGWRGGPALTDQQIFNLFFPVGAQTDTDGSVTFQSVVLPRTFCRGSILLDATGQVATAGNGAVTFLLSNFLCSTVNNFAAPVNLVATPFSLGPAYVTTQYRLVPNPAAPGSFDDLEITLRAWSATGSPAADVVIDWRCRVVSMPVAL
jgi:hypothetical protein